jgi:hypothetical protein
MSLGALRGVSIDNRKLRFMGALPPGGRRLSGGATAETAVILRTRKLTFQRDTSRREAD